MSTQNMILPILGLGLYAQANNINLASNTATLATLFAVLQTQQDIAATNLQLARLNTAIYGTPIASTSICYPAQTPLYPATQSYATGCPLYTV